MKHAFASLAMAMIIAPMGHAQASPVAEPTSSTGWVDQQPPGFYRLRLGDFKVTVLLDGTAARDLPKIMSKPDVVRAEFAASHQTLPVELSINTYLVDTGKKQILVDTGAGELFGNAAGHLVANMRAAGYAPTDIDAILLTHIHADHSGGLSIGGKRVFPHAVVYVDKRDPALWLNRDAEAKAAPEHRKTFEQSQQAVDPYVRAGKLKTFDGATRLFPGIRSIPEPGHTPGMSGYMIESQGKRLLLWGDVIHAAEAQFRHPAITIDYDVDPAQAITTRQRVLREVAEQGYLVGGAHLSFPGLGHVRADGNGSYEWIPAPYLAKP